MGKSQIKVTYEVTYKPDSTSQDTNTEQMALKIQDQTSYFYNETKFQLDSIYEKATREYSRTGVQPNIPLKYELIFGIYKDLKNNEVWEIKNVNSKHFAYPIDIPHLKWTISDETQQKYGYTLKKANTHFAGRDWVAWYAPELPINNGPYKFQGLPGLILELFDSKNDYIFNTISIVNFKDQVKLPKGFIKTTKEKYNDFVDKLVADPALSIRESISRRKNFKMTINGQSISNNEFYDKITNEFNEFKNSHNNPIEKHVLWIR